MDHNRIIEVEAEKLGKPDSMIVEENGKVSGISEKKADMDQLDKCFQ